MLEAFVVAREKMHDADVVLLVLAGLGDDFEALIQHVTSRRDEVTYRELKGMLTDIEVRRGRTNVVSPLSVNMVESEKTTKGGKYLKTIPCQICSKKGHRALNCYNRFNITKFPLTHDRVLTSSGPTGKRSTDMAYKSGTSVWYP